MGQDLAQLECPIRLESLIAQEPEEFFCYMAFDFYGARRVVLEFAESLAFKLTLTIGYEQNVASSQTWIKLAFCSLLLKRLN